MICVGSWQRMKMPLKDAVRRGNLDARELRSGREIFAARRDVDILDYQASGFGSRIKWLKTRVRTATTSRN